MLWHLKLIHASLTCSPDMVNVHNGICHSAQDTFRKGENSLYLQMGC